MERPEKKNYNLKEYPWNTTKYIHKENETELTYDLQRFIDYLQSQLKQAKYKRLNSIFLAQYFRDENKKLQSQLKKERDEHEQIEENLQNEIDDLTSNPK